MIVCASCTVPGEKEIEAVTVVDAVTGVPVEHAAFQAAAFAAGVKMSTALAYAKDGYDHPALPQYHVVVEKKVVPCEQEKTFDGDEDAAEAAGWAQNEYGFVCPPCSATAYTSEEHSAGLAAKLEDVINPLRVAEAMEQEAETADPDRAFELCQQAAKLREGAQ